MYVLKMLRYWRKWLDVDDIAKKLLYDEMRKMANEKFLQVSLKALKLWYNRYIKNTSVLQKALIRLYVPPDSIKYIIKHMFYNYLNEIVNREI